MPSDAIVLFDREIVDTVDPTSHNAMLVELPVLVAVGLKPMAVFVMPLIGKANRDPALSVGPHLFDQAIIELSRPFAGEEGFDLLAALDELGSVPPEAVGV